MNQIDISQMTRRQAVSALGAVAPQAIRDGARRAQQVQLLITGGRTRDGVIELRVVDAVLQRLRKEGVIVFIKGAGWSVKGGAQ